MRRVAAVLATASLCACATPGMQADVAAGAATGVAMPSVPAAMPVASGAAAAGVVTTAPPAAGAAAGIAAPSSAVPDSLGKLVDQLELTEPPVVEIPREPTLVL